MLRLLCIKMRLRNLLVNGNFDSTTKIIHIFTCENNNRHTVYGKKTTVKPWTVNVRIAISALAYTFIRLLSGIYHLEKLFDISKVFL